MLTWSLTRYPILSPEDVGTALLFLGSLFRLQTSVPLPSLHSAPDSQGSRPGRGRRGALATRYTGQRSVFKNRLCQVLAQCHSSAALSDPPEAARRTAEALNGIRSSMAYSVHSLFGGWGAEDPRLCPERIKRTATGAFRLRGRCSQERLLLM